MILNLKDQAVKVVTHLKHGFILSPHLSEESREFDYVRKKNDTRSTCFKLLQMNVEFNQSHGGGGRSLQTHISTTIPLVNVVVIPLLQN